MLDFFSFHDDVSRPTRGHNMKLFKYRFSNLDVAKFSFVNRVVDEWNALPQEAIDSIGVNSFKNKIDCRLKYKRGLYKITLPSLIVGSFLLWTGPSC